MVELKPFGPDQAQDCALPASSSNSMSCPGQISESIAVALAVGGVPAIISISLVLVQPLLSVIVTVYVPMSAAVEFEIVGSWVELLKPFGPAQDHD